MLLISVKNFCLFQVMSGITLTKFIGIVVLAFAKSQLFEVNLPIVSYVDLYQTLTNWDRTRILQTPGLKADSRIAGD